MWVLRLPQCCKKETIIPTIPEVLIDVEVKKTDWSNNAEMFGRYSRPAHMFTTSARAS